MAEPQHIPNEPPDETVGPGEAIPADSENPSEEVLAKSNLLGFILVPAMLVAAVVGIVWVFYALTYQRLSVQDYVKLLRDPNKSVRWQAALDLVQSNRASPDLVPMLIEIVHAPDDEQTLARVGWATSDMLKKPEENKVNLRWYAAAALGKIGGAEALDTLLGLLEDKDEGVRFYASYGLGQIRDPKAVGGLTKLLKEDSDSAVRMTAAWSLGEVADPQARSSLLDAFNGDADKDVRWNCAIALARFGDATGRATLEEMTKADNPHTRDQARRALRLLESQPKN